MFPLARNQCLFSIAILWVGGERLTMTNIVLRIDPIRLATTLAVLAWLIAICSGCSTPHLAQAHDYTGQAAAKAFADAHTHGVPLASEGRTLDSGRLPTVSWPMPSSVRYASCSTPCARSNPPRAQLQPVFAISDRELDRMEDQMREDDRAFQQQMQAWELNDSIQGITDAINDASFAAQFLNHR